MSEPVIAGYDGFGTAIYEHQLPPRISNGDRLVNARDCELAGFDLALVLEAAKRNAP